MSKEYIRIYKIEVLKLINRVGFFKAIENLRSKVGNSSTDEQLERYAKQAEMLFDENGNEYRKVGY